MHNNVTPVKARRRRGNQGSQANLTAMQSPVTSICLQPLAIVQQATNTCRQPATTIHKARQPQASGQVKEAHIRPPQATVANQMHEQAQCNRCQKEYSHSSPMGDWSCQYDHPIWEIVGAESIAAKARWATSTVTQRVTTALCAIPRNEQSLEQRLVHLRPDRRST